jgi:hypothetical protein
MRIAKDLGDRGLPIVGVHAVQQCAEMLGDTMWLGCAVVVRGYATGELDWAAHYRRSVAAAQTLTSLLDSSDALQACGMLHLSAAGAASAQADRDTAATHLQEASALAARMDAEVATWANLFFGSTNIGNWRTSLALKLGEHGQALEAAKTVHPELLPKRRQVQFWSEVGRALAVEKKTREKAVRVLVHAEQLGPQMLHRDPLVREVVSGLLRQALSEAGRRELRGLAWRMGLAPARRARTGDR